MKNLLFFFVLISSNLFSQNFGLLGTEWYYSENAGGRCPGNCEYVHFKSVKDTTIQGKTTHKITQTYYKYGGDTLSLESIYVYNHSDTTFRYSFSKSRFLSLFIFNQKQGDTITLDYPPSYQNIPVSTNDSTYRLVIDSVINTKIDSIPLKEYRVTALDIYQFYNSSAFKDRIGGLDWLFPRATILPESGAQIRCYIDANIDTNFQAVSCDYILATSLSEFQAEDVIEIYPNPTSNILSVRTNQPIDKIELYDLKGQLFKTTSSSTINLSKFAVGQYILKIYFTSGEIIERKIIKSTG